MDLGQQIREAYAREHAAAAPATGIDDLPLSYDAMTDAWLTAVLCHGVTGAHVVSHALDEADDGTNNRRRVFVTYDEAGQRAGLPPSVFCKATHGLSNRLMLGHSNGIQCEVTFYSKIRDRLAMEAPQAYLANYDPVSFNSIVVLEDIAPRAHFCAYNDTITRERAEAMVDLLVRLHARFYDAPELFDDFAALPTWAQRFNNFRVFHLEESCTAGFEASEAFVPARLYARRDEIWPATIRTLELQRDLPLCLCHGDVHLKNWYVTNDGRPGLGDWGSVIKGHWSRDVAYTLSTALTTPDRRAWEQDLLRRYLAGMAAQGVAMPSFDEAFLLYRQSLMTSLAWWTLNVKPSSPDFPLMHEREHIETFVSRMAHAIDDLDALDACTRAPADATV